MRGGKAQQLCVREALVTFLTPLSVSKTNFL